jgi:hypothetical protein
MVNAAANVRVQSEVDMIRQAKPAGSVENDPVRNWSVHRTGRCALRNDVGKFATFR